MLVHEIYEYFDSPIGKMLCLCQTPKIMHGIILYMFDSWANPVVHLLLLKSSMALYFMSQSGSVTANEQ